MPRYVAFLRGVSPMNAKMPDLKAAFEAAGFSDVRTLLSSGNVAFSCRSTPLDALQRKAEKAMQAKLGKVFTTFVRRSTQLQAIIDSDPYAAFSLPDGAKRIVTFLAAPASAEIAVPLERADASILRVNGCEVYSAYVPSPKAPVFMALIERTFGKNVTTRTLETVRKCASA